MPDTVIAAAQRIYPSNNGPNGTALARDEEIYTRDRVRGANFVIGGNLGYLASSLAVTLEPLSVFIDGRQVMQVEGGSYGFTLPANVTRWLLVSRGGNLILRDSATFDAATEVQLWRITTDATGVTGVPVDLRRRNQFTEIGVDSGEFVFLSSDRSVYLYYDPITGRIRAVGVLQPTRVLGLPEPVADDEAAPRSFVLNQATKVARVATTGNITLSGTQTIDGVAVAVDDVVLVKNQTNGADNGPYKVATGAWTRHSYLDSTAKAIAGFTIYVREGTVNAKSAFSLTTVGATLGTTALVFERSAVADVMRAGDATDVQIFTASGTWTKPANAKVVRVVAIGGGGGGGGGANRNAGSARAGGGGGGGGAVAVAVFAASALGATETVTVGAAGAAGAGGAAGGDNSGTAGGPGGTSSFGARLSAFGGGGGGASTTGGAGAGGGGRASAGGGGSGTTGGMGGNPFGAAANTDKEGMGGAGGGNTNAAGGSSTEGGAGGGGTSAGSAGQAGGSSLHGSPGGGSGAGTDNSSSVANVGGSGGIINSFVAGGGAAGGGGANPGNPGATGTSRSGTGLAGNGGAGGGSGTPAGAAGGAGGAGGAPGGGGGGGGAGSTTGGGGAGGAGGRGEVIVITWR